MISQPSLRLLDPLRKCHPRVLLKIQQARIAPPPGFFLLDMQKGLDLAELLRVDIIPERTPQHDHAVDSLYPVIVSEAEFIPQAPARFHGKVPWQVVEPQKEIIGACLRIGISGPDFRSVLREGLTAGLRPVEADAGAVGTVVVHGCPVGTAACDPGPRSVVIPTAHDVMESEGCHVIHGCFPRRKHYLFNGFHHPRSRREGLPDPFLCNTLCAEFMIPGQPAEGIPVGLSEEMAGPVAVGADIRHAGDG